MKECTINTFALWLTLMFPVGMCLAEPAAPKPQAQELELYDYFVAMQHGQERLSRKSPEEQERLQSQVRRAELQACQRLMQDRQKGLQAEYYRRQGGDEFVGYVLQFEKYCEMLR